MNVSEGLNPFPVEDELASGPFVVEVQLDEELVKSVGYDLTLNQGVLKWWSNDHAHWQRLKGAPRSDGDSLRFVRDDNVKFLLRPLVPGDGPLAGIDDSDFLEMPPEEGVPALRRALREGFLADDVAPPAPEFDQTDLTLALNAEGTPVGLFRLNGAAFPLQRVNGAWKRLSPDVEDDVFGASDVDVRPEAIEAWDAGKLNDALLAKTDAYQTGSPFERLFLALSSDEGAEDSTVQGLFAERSRGRLYRRSGNAWSAIPRDELGTVDSIDVTTGAISAWDDGTLNTLVDIEKYDRNGDTL